MRGGSWAAILQKVDFQFFSFAPIPPPPSFALLPSNLTLCHTAFSLSRLTEHSSPHRACTRRSSPPPQHETPEHFLSTRPSERVTCLYEQNRLPLLICTAHFVPLNVCPLPCLVLDVQSSGLDHVFFIFPRLRPSVFV